MVSGDLGEHLTGSLRFPSANAWLVMWTSKLDGEILGGTANIPQQFGIEFSMKLKPSNVFRSTKITLLLRKSLPVSFDNNDTKR